jgi:hypothetical protein
VTDLFDRLNAAADALLGGGGVHAVKAGFREDDQRVREFASALLAQARVAVTAAEGAYRRTHIKPPTRANPFPDAAAIAGAQALERLASDIGALEGRVRHQPVIEADRLGDLDARLADLIAQDRRLAEGATKLQALATEDGEALLAHEGDLRDAIRGVAEALTARELSLR